MNGMDFSRKEAVGVCIYTLSWGSMPVRYTQSVSEQCDIGFQEGMQPIIRQGKLIFFSVSHFDLCSYVQPWASSGNRKHSEPIRSYLPVDIITIGAHLIGRSNVGKFNLHKNILVMLEIL